MPPTVNDHRDGPRDECGVFGIFAPGHDVANLTYFALYALQHRGQESAGIATAPRGREIMAIRDQGLVAQVFDEHKLRSLIGDMAIGHVRYSTTGASAWENTQPIVRDDRRTLALAHNGNLINAVELHSELRDRGFSFSSTSDSEIIAALLATHPADRIEDAIADVLPRLQGAFSTVVLTEESVVAFRDPHGLRPLALGVIENEQNGATAYCVASESCAFDLIGAKYLREVLPGEVITLTDGGVQTRIVAGSERRAFCVFEYIYFARPDSKMAGTVLQVARGRMGEILWREAPVDADLVIPVPDSGNPAARGLARAAGLPAGRRLHQEPLRRPDLHPARPGAAQARPAAQVQPAARSRRRQATDRRRRLDRARQHHPPDRSDAARRRRGRDPPADLRAADQASLPLRDRHVEPRGDDRPRADASRRSPTSSAPTRCTTCRSRACTRRSACRARPTATPASAARTRSRAPRKRSASSRSSCRSSGRSGP